MARWVVVPTTYSMAAAEFPPSTHHGRQAGTIQWPSLLLVACPACLLASPAFHGEAMPMPPGWVWAGWQWKTHTWEVGTRFYLQHACLCCGGSP